MKQFIPCIFWTALCSFGLPIHAQNQSDLLTDNYASLSNEVVITNNYSNHDIVLYLPTLTTSNSDKEAHQQFWATRAYATQPTTSNISGYLWHDNNNNSTKEAKESTMSYIKVVLYNNNDTPIATTLSDRTGYYSFDILTSGKYKVGIAASSIPANFSLKNRNTRNFIITNPKQIDEVNFGFITVSMLPTGSISGTVWDDANVNAFIDETEIMLNEVTVLLYDADLVLLTSTLTDSNGYYEFTSVLSNDYVVVVDVSSAPFGYWLSTNGNLLVSLNDGEAYTNAHFGLYDAATTNQAPIANDDLVYTNVSLNPIPINAMANDFDPNGDDCLILSYTEANYGSISFDGEIFSYTPIGFPTAVDSFQYHLCDEYDACSMATVRIQLLTNIEHNNNTPNANKNIVAPTTAMPTTNLIIDKLYPNPTTVQLNINYTATQEIPTSIEVYNIMGVCVYRYETNSTLGDNTQLIDTADYASGYYLVKMVQNGHITSKAFIKS